jgi:hypothetical protein
MATLSECVERIVGAPPDALATRGLGLVPVADPATFAWAGPWIARLGDPDRHAVMFGVPSAPIFDPVGGDPAVLEGWLVAPLDVAGWVPATSVTEPGTGVVEAIYVFAEREGEGAAVPSARALAGVGLDGDRYARGEGTFSRPGATGLALTLVEAEALERVDLAFAGARRNVVTRGVRLNALVGRRFRVGDVECFGQRLCEPCAHLQRLTRPGILRALVHQGGLRADILSDGAIAAGDAVVAVDRV